MIFIFSATGNSYHVSRLISESLGIQKVDLAAAVRYKRFLYDAKGEDVGFVFPVYFLGIPNMVKVLAENLEVRNPGKVFCVVTCGGHSGKAGEMLQECLGKRLKIDSYFDVIMPDNAVFYEDVPSKEEQDRINAEADVVIQGIIEKLKAGETGDFRKHAGQEESEELYAQYEDARVTEPFTINDRCIECRICEDVCPEQIIKIYHRKPVWDEEKCSMCMSCLNLCPKKAIEFGDVTKERGRYHHPDYYERIIGIPLKY